MRISLIAGILITGISVYIILSYFLIPQKITIPISVIMSLLSFGLTRYYFISYQKYLNDSNVRTLNIDASRKQFKEEQSVPNVIFIFLFSTCIIICLVLSQPDLEDVYTNWYNVGITGLATLGAGIVLSFFLPGMLYYSS